MVFEIRMDTHNQPFKGLIVPEQNVVLDGRISPEVGGGERGVGTCNSVVMNALL